ncbi:hypothetical protein, partial [Paraburkholderia tuberum]|uniref:hypothetical protein n=1 Tax=Paraburkholderia tuberum TaxID=157910 RepID=UPI001ABC506C
PKTRGQSSAHGDQTSNHFEIEICGGLFSVALGRRQYASPCQAFAARTSRIRRDGATRHRFQELAQLF